MTLKILCDKVKDIWKRKQIQLWKCQQHLSNNKINKKNNEEILFRNTNKNSLQYINSSLHTSLLPLIWCRKYRRYQEILSGVSVLFYRGVSASLRSARSWLRTHIQYIPLGWSMAVRSPVYFLIVSSG